MQCANVGVIRLGMCGCSICWGYKVGVCPGIIGVIRGVRHIGTTGRESGIVIHGGIRLGCAHRIV